MTQEKQRIDTGDDSLYNVRRLRAQIRELERENNRLRDKLHHTHKLLTRDIAATVLMSIKGN